MGSLFDQQPKLFQDPGINYPIDNLKLGFADYISQTRNIIRNTRLDLQGNPEAELIIEANCPFELRPSSKPKIGALLTHGLFDSPLMMRDIGLHLQSQGILARSILLPGHGTIPGALLNTTYEDWLQALRYGIASLKNEVDQIILVGFSTGASLSLLHAFEDHTISSLILTSPAFKIRSTIDFAANWHRAISWAWPRAAWVHIATENDYAKYQSMTYNAAYQVYRLAKEIKEREKNDKVICPILMALCEGDKTVSSPASVDYFKSNTNPKNKLIYYTNSKDIPDDARIIARKTAYPELSIIDFSHIAIPIAPTNPHYGENGDYIYASHVNNNENKYVYGEINTAEDMFLTLLSKLKIKGFDMERLTFNPDFEFMIQTMQNFMANASD